MTGIDTAPGAANAAERPPPDPAPLESPDLGLPRPQTFTRPPPARPVPMKWLPRDELVRVADPLGAALEFLDNCQRAGLFAYLEKSGGGAGWHVWVFFAPGVTAADARR